MSRCQAKERLTPNCRCKFTTCCPEAILPSSRGGESVRSSRQVIKNHEMGVFDDQVGKNRGLPAGAIGLHSTLRDVQFFEQVGLYVLSPMACSKNEVLRNCRVEPLQFRHPEASLGYCPGRNLSEKLEVIRVHLLEYGDRAGCPYEIDAPGCRVVLEVIGAANTVQHLNHFSRFRIHDDQLPRFILVSASDFTGMWFHPATHKQAMMG